jgi:hypothetical protein
MHVIKKNRPILIFIITKNVHKFWRWLDCCFVEHICDKSDKNCKKKELKDRTRCHIRDANRFQYQELGVLLDNPLSAGRLSEFHEVSGWCGQLPTRMPAAQRRHQRLARAMRVARGTVVACAGAIVVVVVLTAHTVVGIGAAAVAGSCPAAAVRWAAERVSERRYTRARGRGGALCVHSGAGPGHSEPHGVVRARRAGARMASCR